MSLHLQDFVFPADLLDPPLSEVAVNSSRVAMEGLLHFSQAGEGGVHLQPRLWILAVALAVQKLLQHC